MTDTEDPAAAERADLLQLLRQHRMLLRATVRGLDDAQAAARPTASELCLGGIIKHVAFVERGWANFVLEGPSAVGLSPDQMHSHVDSFQMNEGETLAGLLEEYARVAERTDELVETLTDFDGSHPLPEAPWFEPGARWTARRALVHIAAETAQHAGHADIIRESIDGAKTMG
jgi:uncharacterized damage-inducible protein DinB